MDFEALKAGRAGKPTIVCVNFNHLPPQLSEIIGVIVGGRYGRYIYIIILYIYTLHTYTLRICPVYRSNPPRKSPLP
jgi:hypothetical protein